MKKLILSIVFMFALTISASSQAACTDTVNMIGIFVDSTDSTVKSDTLSVIRCGQTWNVQNDLAPAPVSTNVFDTYTYRLDGAILPEKWIIKTIQY